MSEPKHTRGPWGFGKHGTPDYAPQFGVYAVGASKDHVIVKGDSLENAQANARLIAAAPELLEAAEWLMAELSSRFDYETATPEEETIFCHMENVIAKARGDK